MCSLNWRQFGTHIGIAFNRDESVLRSKAEIPKVFDDGNGKFLMPRDPAGNGSWLSANQYGYVFLLLNDYQGQLKQDDEALISRGLLIRGLASCRSLNQVVNFVEQIDLTKSQPFYLAVISQLKQTCWHYDGRKTVLSESTLPQQIYSSGHPDAEKIIQLRTDYVSSLKIASDEDLLTLHKSHQPILNDTLDLQKGSTEAELSYPICMHRTEAKTQSLTYIKLTSSKVEMKYWNGQPCSTDQYCTAELKTIASDI
jgi:hypothetical protein